MSNQPIEAQFLAAILAEPGDDLHRLAFADWLDEQGDPRAAEQRLAVALRHIIASPADDGLRLEYASTCEAYGWPERAEFIRVQVELAKGPDCDAETPYLQHLKGYCRPCDLRRREDELLLGRPVGADAWEGPILEALQRDSFGPVCTFRRGFVAGVCLPLAAWCGERCGRCDGGGQRIGADRPFEYVPNATEALRCPDCSGSGVTGRHAPALVRAAPLEVVRTERRPHMDFDRRWYWSVIEDARDEGAIGYLPAAVCNLLPEPDHTRNGEASWDTEDRALSAASTGLLAWGRYAAELADVRAELAAIQPWPVPKSPRELTLRAREAELARLVG